MITGVRRYVDEFFNWLDCRFWPVPFKNPDLLPQYKDQSGNILKEGNFLMTSRVRYGVYGTIEAVFPEEHKDIYLSTLQFHNADFTAHTEEKVKRKIKRTLANMEIAAFRKLIGCEPIPQFNVVAPIPMPEDILQNIRIIPIGVRYDVKEWKSPSGLVYERI